MRYNTLNDVKPEIIRLIVSNMLNHKFEYLLDFIKQYDYTITSMRLTQIVSDLYIYGYIDPVFYNPVTKKYTLFPKEYINELNEIGDIELRSKKYTRLKKTLASRAKRGIVIKAETSAIKMETMQNVKLEKKTKDNLITRIINFFKSF